MKKKKLLLVVFLCSIFLVLLIIYFNSKSEIHKKIILFDDNYQNIISKNLNYSNKKSAHNNQILGKQVENFSKKEIQDAKKFFSVMKVEYTKLKFEHDFKLKILELYGRNKNIANIFKKIIIDHNFALNVSEDDQAYARVFSILALKEIAFNSDKKPLITTILDLSNSLQEKNLFSKGEQADFEDLLLAYISIFDPNQFAKNIEKHLIEVGFNKDIKNRKILDIYDQSIFFALSEKLGREKAKQLLDQYFES